MTPRAMVQQVRGMAAIAKRGAPLLAVGFLADASFLMVYLVVLQTYLPESLGASAAIAGWALAAYGLAKLITQVRDATPAPHRTRSGRRARSQGTVTTNGRG